MRRFQIALAALLLMQCTYNTTEPEVDCTDFFELSVEGVENSSCGLSIGQFEIVVINASSIPGDLRFTLNGETQSDGVFTALAAGDYTVQISDGVCETSQTVQIQNAEGLQIQLSSDAASCGESNGSITVSTTDAIGEVEFSIDEGAFQDGNVFSGLVLGSYTVTARDGSGCAVSGTIDVTSSEIPFENINSIIRTNCAISGCHAGNVNPDLRTEQNIVNRAARIVARTSAKTMPPRSSGRELSDAEIALIACWFENL